MLPSWVCQCQRRSLTVRVIRRYKWQRGAVVTGCELHSGKCSRSATRKAVGAYFVSRFGHGLISFSAQSLAGNIAIFTRDSRSRLHLWLFIARKLSCPRVRSFGALHSYANSSKLSLYVVITHRNCPRSRLSDEDDDLGS